MPIEAYEIGPEGAHIAVSTGDASASGTGAQDAAAPAQTDAPAVNGELAPPQSTPPPDSGLAAPDAEEGDDADVPETATVDYVAKRINRLNARYRSEQRAREADRQAAEQRLAQQQGQIEALTRLLQGATPELPQTPQGPPQAEQFDSHDAYVRAAARYEAEQVTRAQQQQMTQQAQAQQMQRDLMEREAAFRQAHPDFDQVITQGLRGRIAPQVQQALMMLPEGPQLAYTLAQQPETLTRLNQLPPPLVFAELGRLMPGQVVPGANGSAPAGTPPAPSNGQTPTPPLPEPMRPVGGNGSAPVQGFREGMNLTEYRQWRARGR